MKKIVTPMYDESGDGMPRECLWTVENGARAHVGMPRHARACVHVAYEQWDAGTRGHAAGMPVAYEKWGAGTRGHRAGIPGLVNNGRGHAHPVWGFKNLKG